MNDPQYRETPRSIETEQAVLGALLESDCYAKVSSLISGPDDFFDPVHRAIYDVVESLARQGMVVSFSTVKAHMPDQEIAPGMSIAAYLGKLVGAAPPARHVTTHARIIRKLAARRVVIAIAEETAAAAYDAAPDVDPKDMARDAIVGLHDATKDNQSSAQVQSLAEMGLGVVEFAQGRARNEIKPPPELGLPDLDRAIGGGLHSKRMTVVGGRPGSGKTAFMASLMRQHAAKGHGCLGFSIEIPKEEMVCRILSDHVASNFGMEGFQTKLEYTRIMNGWLKHNSELQVLAEAERQVRGLPLYLDDRGSVSVADVELATRIEMDKAARRGLPIRSVWIDFLQRMKAPSRSRGNKTEELGEIALGLKEMAKRLDVHVILFSQLSREVEKRDDKRPQLSDLRGSGEIEEHADVIMFLYREAYYLERSPDYQAGLEGAMSIYMTVKDDLDVIIQKNRFGPTQTVKMFADVKFSQIASKAMV